MNNLLKQRLLLSVTGRHLMKEPKKFNFIGLKNGRASYSNSDPLCPPPSKDPPSPCPPQRDPPPCPPPPPPCGPPCPPPPYAAVPDPCNPCNGAQSADADGYDYASSKKAICAYQQEHGTPTYLRGGKFNVYSFQGVTLLGCFTFIYSLYVAYEFTVKFP